LGQCHSSSLSRPRQPCPALLLPLILVVPRSDHCPGSAAGEERVGEGEEGSVARLAGTGGAGSRQRQLSTCAWVCERRCVMVYNHVLCMCGWWGVVVGLLVIIWREVETTGGTGLSARGIESLPPFGPSPLPPPPPPAIARQGRAGSVGCRGLDGIYTRGGVSRPRRGTPRASSHARPPSSIDGGVA
jgi:hypothetical protein